MDFLKIVIFLFILSFMWAIFSLIREFKKPRETEEVKEELKKERVIYRS